MKRKNERKYFDGTTLDLDEAPGEFENNCQE